jgi:hypothetical protein
MRSGRFVAGGLLAALLVLGAAALRGTAEEKKAGAEAGWVRLFNGKDLTGWKLPPEPNKGAIKEVIPKLKDGKVIAYYGKWSKGGKTVEGPLWRVEDGILIGSGPASHLFSERGDYENFHFRIEAMINDKGNSGQYFRTQFGGGFPKGYEAQINATHTDRIRTGSLYGFKEATVLKAPHKPDEWFTQEVIANGNHIIIKVNGSTTVDYKVTDKGRLYTKGHFALQGHDPGTVVKFRKIEVKELPPRKE